MASPSGRPGTIEGPSLAGPGNTEIRAWSALGAEPHLTTPGRGLWQVMPTLSPISSSQKQAYFLPLPTSQSCHEASEDSGAKNPSADNQELGCEEFDICHLPGHFYIPVTQIVSGTE